MPAVRIYQSGGLPPMILAFFLAFADFHSSPEQKVREILAHSMAYRPHTLPADPDRQLIAVDRRSSTIRTLHMSSPDMSPYKIESQSEYGILSISQRYEGTNPT